MNNPFYSTIEDLSNRAEYIKLTEINKIIQPCQDSMLSKIPLGDVIIAQQLKRIADSIEDIELRISEISDSMQIVSGEKSKEGEQDHV